MKLFKKKIGQERDRCDEKHQTYISLKEDLSREKKSSIFKEEDTEFLVANLEDFTKRIGKMNSYYIQAFCKRDRFNLGAAMGGVFWLGYRGMFRELFLAYTVIFFMDVIFLHSGMDVSLGPVIGAVLGMYGNYLYFKSLQRRIESNKKEVRRDLGVLLSFCVSILYLLLLPSYISII